jgi:hypothetical protein
MRNEGFEVETVHLDVTGGEHPENFLKTLPKALSVSYPSDEEMREIGSSFSKLGLLIRPRKAIVAENLFARRRRTPPRDWHHGNRTSAAVDCTW